MDPNGNIYPLEGVIADLKEQRQIDEDAARLDGYLRARAEADYMAILKEIDDADKQGSEDRQGVPESDGEGAV